MKKKVVIAILVLIAAAAVVWFFLLRESGPDGMRFSWPRGSVYVYQAAYTTDSQTSVLMGSTEDSPTLFHALVDYDFELVLRSYGRKGDGGEYLLGMSFQNFEKHQLSFMDVEQLPDQAAVKKDLLSREALIEINDLGEVKTLSFAPDTPSAFSGLVQALVGETMITLSPYEKVWKAREKSQRGESIASYEVTKETEKQYEISKKKDDYIELVALDARRPLVELDREVNSGFEIALAREGHLDSIEGGEKITVSDPEEGTLLRIDTKVRLRLLRRETFEPKSPVDEMTRGMLSRTLAEIILSQNATDQILEQRVGTMTFEQMESDLKHYGRLGEMPRQNLWLWQATGLLLKDPKRAADLIKVFESPEIDTFLAKRSVMDVLALAGNKESQSALRTLLASEKSRTDADYFKLLQRLSKLEAPDEETARFTLDLFNQLGGQAGGNPMAAYASAYALGAITRRTPDGPQAREFNQALMNRLQGVRDEDDRYHYLIAVKNAARKENVPRVAEYLKEESVKVRRAAVMALEYTQTDESEQILMDLAGDDEPRIQQAVFNTLGNYQLKGEHYERINELVTDGEILEQSWGGLVNVLTRDMTEGDIGDPSFRALMENILTVEGLSNKQKERIRRLLP